MHRPRSSSTASSVVADSQTVKAPAAKTRGYDAGKKIVGRKRHIVVDTDGRLLMVNLTPADISDSAGAQAILDAIRKRYDAPSILVAQAEPADDGSGAGLASHQAERRRCHPLHAERAHGIGSRQQAPRADGAAAAAELASTA